MFKGLGGLARAVCAAWRVGIAPIGTAPVPPSASRQALRVFEPDQTRRLASN